MTPANDDSGHPDKAASVLYELDIPNELLRLHQTFRGFFQPRIRPTGVSHQRWRILHALALDGEVEVTQLSRRAVVPPASLSRLLPVMERDGHITRTWHSGDKRRILVNLTPLGRKFHDVVSGIIKTGLEDIARSLDAQVLIDVGHKLRSANEELEKLTQHRANGRRRKTGSGS